MKGSKRVEPTFELDVTPILSLIVHLIPMILIAVRFTTMAEVRADGPVLPTTEAPSAEAFSKQTTNVVSVRINDQGFLVTGAGDAEPRVPCKGACAPETYDYAQLNAVLRAAKVLHPDENRVVVAPEGAVPFEVIARAMAAAREDRSAGKPKTPLFSQPLLASPPPVVAPQGATP